MKPTGLLLGFDYGSRQIGVAVGESTTCSARPLCTLAAKQGQPDWRRVAALLETWQPDYLVVGLPLNMDDSEGPSALAARKFAGRLHGRFGCKVELHDERLSSREARSLLRENSEISSEPGQRVAHNQIDAHAAALILQSWLSVSAGNDASPEAR